MFSPVSEQVREAHSLHPQYVPKGLRVNINDTYGQRKLAKSPGEIVHNFLPVNI